MVPSLRICGAHFDSPHMPLQCAEGSLYLVLKASTKLDIIQAGIPTRDTTNASQNGCWFYQFARCGLITCGKLTRKFRLGEGQKLFTKRWREMSRHRGMICEWKFAPHFPFSRCVKSRHVPIPEARPFVAPPYHTTLIVFPEIIGWKGKKHKLIMKMSRT
jgi:hypothetical protein